jgi:hypothetical protein
VGIIIIIIITIILTLPAQASNGGTQWNALAAASLPATSSLGPGNVCAYPQLRPHASVIAITITHTQWSAHQQRCTQSETIMTSITIINIYNHHTPWASHQQRSRPMQRACPQPNHAV